MEASQNEAHRPGAPADRRYSSLLARAGLLAWSHYSQREWFNNPRGPPTVDWVQRTDEIFFRVGGILKSDLNKHFHWATPKIGLGDEIAIRVIDVDQCDEPQHVYEPGIVEREQD